MQRFFGVGQGRGRNNVFICRVRVIFRNTLSYKGTGFNRPNIFYSTTTNYTPFSPDVAKHKKRKYTTKKILILILSLVLVMVKLPLRYPFIEMMLEN